MKNFWQDFKTFALRGNAFDLAVGVMIGAAFQSVVTSLTENILSPIIGLFVRGNFDDLVLDWPSIGVTIRYGAFITAVVNFMIMALVIFILVRLMKRLTEPLVKSEPEAPAAPTTQTCPYCLTEIPIGATRCPACTSVLEG
jgi:large conductance mechanosensitive channel